MSRKSILQSFPISPIDMLGQMLGQGLVGRALVGGRQRYVDTNPPATSRSARARARLGRKTQQTLAAVQAQAQASNDPADDLAFDLSQDLVSVGANLPRAKKAQSPEDQLRKEAKTMARTGYIKLRAIQAGQPVVDLPTWRQAVKAFSKEFAEIYDRAERGSAQSLAILQRAMKYQVDEKTLDKQTKQPIRQRGFQI